MLEGWAIAVLRPTARSEIRARGSFTLGPVQTVTDGVVCIQGLVSKQIAVSITSNLIGVGSELCYFSCVHVNFPGLDETRAGIRPRWRL